MDLPNLRPGARTEKERWTLIAWLALIPTLTIILLYRWVPLAWNFVLTFQERSYTGETTFVGLQNYERLLADPVFVESLTNNLILLGTIPVGVTLALGIALLVNQQFFGSNAFRSMFFLPYILMMVAIAVTWSYMFKHSNGVLNHILLQAGIIDSGISWTGNSRWGIVSVFIVHVWKTIGFYMIIILAGLQTIPHQVYEVSRIDGANAVQRFRYITLPLLRPTLGVCVLVGLIASWRLFDLIIVMTGGGPAHGTEILLTYIYKQAFQFGRFGYAAVLTVVLFVLMITIVFVGQRLQRGVEP